MIPTQFPDHSQEDWEGARLSCIDEPVGRHRKSRLHGADMSNAQSPEFFPLTFLDLLHRFDAVELQKSECHLFFVISTIRDRLGRENRQRMILIVHLRLNILTRHDVFPLLGGFVGMQPHFVPVLPLDDNVIAFDA
jgi:hypothetical protein